MSVTDKANTAGLEVVAWRFKSRDGFGSWSFERSDPSYLNPDAYVTEPLVTAASAEARIAELEARIAELEAERDQIAGESIWWRAVIGDGEYAPSGEVPSIKHLHPATVKPIYEAHKGTAVADVIAGLIFSRAITENREQFLVGCANGRAQAAEARADRLARVVVDLKKAFGDPMTRRALGGHSETQQAAILAASAALQQEG